ncbi:hypothetical protein [Polaribacter ponticola]|uniref:Uncharacterized protein n=1 Tax=Polaribacter ponticola TaxID=2978475 RepID=A0ABT5S723_9FLAO|nr:hypothetical protein [Polaribacter sp. MSW5]MDD7913899.1 hypothetical protein [Polaribacter sp. MSW5]
MTLQRKLMLKIDEFCGIQSLITFLEKFKNTVNESDKIYFNNIIDYFSLFYEQTIPVEKHAVEFREATLKSIAVLESYNKDKNCETLNFLINLISYKLEAVSNIKGLAS